MMIKQELILIIIVSVIFALIYALKIVLKNMVEKEGVWRTQCFVVRRAKGVAPRHKFICELTSTGKKKFGDINIMAGGDTIESAYAAAVEEVRIYWRKYYEEREK